MSDIKKTKTIEEIGKPMKVVLKKFMNILYARIIKLLIKITNTLAWCVSLHSQTPKNSIFKKLK